MCSRFRASASIPAGEIALERGLRDQRSLLHQSGDPVAQLVREHVSDPDEAASPSIFRNDLDRCVVVRRLSADRGVDEAPVLIIDGDDSLTQAVINLISNALKFTPKGGVIAVGAQLSRGAEGPEAIIITITDTGVGIKPEDQKRIFEKYKQSGNKSLRGGGGTGLGLYIVKQIIEGHGGSVELASLPGVGTSMVLKLPVKRTAA